MKNTSTIQTTPLKKRRMLILFLFLIIESSALLRPKEKRVTAGTYGSLTEVPVVTVDAFGIVTDASTITADAAATPDTYVTRDVNAASSFGALTLGGTNDTAIQLLAGTTPLAGITFGVDTLPTSTNLYRSDAGRLQTDSVFVIAPPVNTLFASGPGTTVRYSTNIGPLWNISTPSAFNVGGLRIDNYFSNSAIGTNAVYTAVVSSGGSGYVVGDLVVASGGNANSQLRVTTVDVDGAIVTLLIVRGGSGYTASNDVALTGGSGVNATANITAATVALSFAIGLNVKAVYANGGYSTTAITNAIGVRVTGLDRGNGPITITNNQGIVFDNMNVPATTVVAIQTAAIGGGTSTNSGIVIGPVGGGATTNTGISIFSVSGAKTNVGISIGSVSGTATTNIGINVGAVSGVSTTNAGIKIARASGGTSNYALWLADTTGVTSGGITFGSDTSPSTNLYRSAAKTLKTDADFIARKHYTINAAIPTTMAGTGAGTGPTIAVATGSTDCKMQISVTTGSAPAAAATIFTLTYNTAFTNALNLGNTCVAANAAAAAAMTTTYVTGETLALFKLNVGATALPASTLHLWNCQACT